MLDPDGRVLGNLCAMDGVVRHWTEADIETLGTLASAAGGEIALRLALREADRYAATAAALADILQQSLLPAAAPHLPGVQIGIRFRAGGTGVEVMGDIYDVVAAGSGFGVVVGDVCGRGATAAGTTAMARSAVRTAAHLEADPNRVLSTVNEVLYVWFGERAALSAPCTRRSRRRCLRVPPGSARGRCRCPAAVIPLVSSAAPVVMSSS